MRLSRNLRTHPLNSLDKAFLLQELERLYHTWGKEMSERGASIHLSRGTPYIYMGEEIGMIDPDYDSMADYVDVESINAYQMLLDQGQSPKQAFKIIQAKSRDNSRTPMQWDASLNAGFSTGCHG